MAIPSSLLTEKNPRFWGEAPLWRDLMRFVRLLGQRRSIRWGHDRITKARRIKMELKTKQNNPEEAKRSADLTGVFINWRGARKSAL